MPLALCATPTTRRKYIAVSRYPLVFQRLLYRRRRLYIGVVLARSIIIKGRLITDEVPPGRSQVREGDRNKIVLTIFLENDLAEQILNNTVAKVLRSRLSLYFSFLSVSSRPPKKWPETLKMKFRYWARKLYLINSRKSYQMYIVLLLDRTAILK